MKGSSTDKKDLQNNEQESALWHALDSATATAKRWVLWQRPEAKYVRIDGESDKDTSLQALVVRPQSPSAVNDTGVMASFSHFFRQPAQPALVDDRYLDLYGSKEEEAKRKEEEAKIVALAKRIENQIEKHGLREKDDKLSAIERERSKNKLLVLECCQHVVSGWSSVSDLNEELLRQEKECQLDVSYAANDGWIEGYGKLWGAIVSPVYTRQSNPSETALIAQEIQKIFADRVFCSQDNSMDWEESPVEYEGGSYLMPTRVGR